MEISFSNALNSYQLNGEIHSVCWWLELEKKRNEFVISETVVNKKMNSLFSD